MLNEELLEAWVGLTFQFKNSRMTKGLTYNEATVLLYTYAKYKKDALPISAMEVLQKTRMQKSLLNRTVDSLVKKNLIHKEKSEKDGREICIAINPDQLHVFQNVHENSLSIIDHIIDTIGEDDARTFIRIYQKLSSTEI